MSEIQQSVYAIPSPTEETQKRDNLTTWVFYLVALIEGAAVMACELLAAKMIAPYYGTSLYVWTAVLGTTLGGLTTGYFAGGYFSFKYPSRQTLLYIILFSALFMAIMPLTSNVIMEATLSMDVRMGSTISCMVFLFPPLVFFGMASPTIIRLTSDHVKTVGKRAGTVYAVSTLGGIFTTFLFGFYIIPYWGLKLGAYVTAAALSLIAGFYFVMLRRT